MAEWLAHPPAKQEVCSSNLASYLCWNMHVGKATGCYAGHIHQQSATQRWISGNIYHVHLCKVWKKAAHSGFETQRRHHQKSKTVVSVPPPPKKPHKHLLFYLTNLSSKLEGLAFINTSFIILEVFCLKVVLLHSVKISAVCSCPDSKASHAP